jgi:hypothetical protein
MKAQLIGICLGFISITSHAQFTLHKEIDGVQFYTKIANEKWYSKKSPKVLMVKVVNKNSVAANFTMGVELFANLLMIEESPEVNYCIGAGKKMNARRAGLVFKPNDEMELSSFELSGLLVTKSDKADCPK